MSDKAISFQNYLYSFEEACDFRQAVQSDVAELEGASTDGAMEGWYDLCNLSGQYADLLTDSNSTASSEFSKISSDAETYLQQVTIEVQSPTAFPGQQQQINLYQGSGTDSGTQETLWGVINSDTSTLHIARADTYMTTDSYPCSWLPSEPNYSGGGTTPDGITYGIYNQNNGNYDYGEVQANGSLEAWEKYMILNTGGASTSALTNDLLA